MPAMSRAMAVPAAALALVGALAGCSSSAGGGPTTAVKVAWDDTTCAVAPSTVVPGTVEITASYTGTGTAEVYLYGQENGAFTKILGEVEDLTPGLTKSFQAQVATGAYEVKCEAGGKDVRSKLTVS